MGMSGGNSYGDPRPPRGGGYGGGYGALPGGWRGFGDPSSPPRGGGYGGGAMPGFNGGYGNGNPQTGGQQQPWQPPEGGSQPWGPKYEGWKRQQQPAYSAYQISRAQPQVQDRRAQFPGFRKNTWA